MRILPAMVVFRKGKLKGSRTGTPSNIGQSASRPFCKYLIWVCPKVRAPSRVGFKGTQEQSSHPEAALCKTPNINSPCPRVRKGLNSQNGGGEKAEATVLKPLNFKGHMRHPDQLPQTISLGIKIKVGSNGSTSESRFPKQIGPTGIPSPLTPGTLPCESLPEFLKASNTNLLLLDVCREPPTFQLVPNRST